MISCDSENLKQLKCIFTGDCLSHITNSMDISLSKLQEIVEDIPPSHAWMACGKPWDHKERNTTQRLTQGISTLAVAEGYIFLLRK